MMILVTLVSATIALVEATIPIYYDCHRIILLNERDQPAAIQHISFSSGDMSTKDCLVQVLKHDTWLGDRIGVLLLGSDSFKSFTTFCSDAIDTYILTADFFDKPQQPGVDFSSFRTEYCSWHSYSNYEKVHDTNIATNYLNFSWTKYAGSLTKNFDAFVFLYSFDYICYSGRVSCDRWSSVPNRCIPESIVCEYPYTFCNSNKYLCPRLLTTTTEVYRPSNVDSNYPGSSSNRNEYGMIIAIVGVSAVALLLLCLCCFCCKSRIKGFSGPNTSSSSVWIPNESNASGGVQMVHLTRRTDQTGTSNFARPSNAHRMRPTPRESSAPTTRQQSYYPQGEENSSNVDSENGAVIFTLDADFIEGPPVYDTLDTTEVNVNVSDAGIDDPPSYETVVAHAQEYKVIDATASY